MNEIKTPFSNLKNKTGKHKDWYTPSFVTIFCKQINPENKLFDNQKFVGKFRRNYQEFELKGRLDLIVRLIDEFISDSCDYSFKLSVLARLFSKPFPHQEGMFNHGFFLYPVSQYVETHGDKDIKLSFDFIEKLTQEFTGEWAIRTLANHAPKETLAKMKEWSSNENFHLRRLASEGLRARLPWGKKIDWIETNPEKSIPIYKKLRNDPVLYVRRSVANAMGDLIKINQSLAMKTFESWLKNKNTRDSLWVIKHAIRLPVKKKVKEFTDLSTLIDQMRDSL